MSLLSPYKFFEAIGSAAMVETFSPGLNFTLVDIRVHVDNAPTGQPDLFIVTVDATSGVEHDIVILSQNMITVTDLIRTFPEPSMPFQNGDKLIFAWDNNGSDTWGLTVAYREEV